MPDALLADPAAAAAGLFAAACLAVWPLFRTRRGILLAQLGISVGFAVHYGLLGITAASLVNVLGSVQTVAALFATRNVAVNRIGYALVPLMIAVGVCFWTGPISALAVTAMALIALGRMQHNQWTLRLMLLAAATVWLAHDYMVGSWIAVSADIASLATGSSALIRMLLAEQSRAGAHA